jgi:hypothetical protein
MIEAMKQALEFFESGNFVYPTKIATDLRQAIAGLESQEPVAWVQDVEFEQLPEFAFSWVKTRLHDKPLYTHPLQHTEQNFCPRCGKRTNDIHTCTPPQREWVGLTDDEIIDVIHPLVMADMSDQATDYEIAKAIEAKLKQKNGFAEEKI